MKKKKTKITVGPFNLKYHNEITENQLYEMAKVTKVIRRKKLEKIFKKEIEFLIFPNIILYKTI